MHDFSQWLQSADGMDWTPILIAGILISLAIAVTCESVMAIFAALRLRLLARRTALLHAEIGNRTGLGIAGGLVRMRPP